MGATLRCGVKASHCVCFSCCGAWALGTQSPVVVASGLSSCGSQALESRLSSCGAWAELIHMWDLPRPGIEPMSPALANRFLTTVPPGSPWNNVLIMLKENNPKLSPYTNKKIFQNLKKNEHSFLDKEDLKEIFISRTERERKREVDRY